MTDSWNIVPQKNEDLHLEACLPLVYIATMYESNSRKMMIAIPRPVRSRCRLGNTAVQYESKATGP